HYQIIGGDLDALLAHRLDELEILLGEREDRDLREVDLLPPREVEQQVERALVAAHLDVHDFVAGRLGRLRGLEPVGLRIGGQCGHVLGYANEARILHTTLRQKAGISVTRTPAHRICRRAGPSRWWRSSRRPAP